MDRRALLFTLLVLLPAAVGCEQSPTGEVPHSEIVFVDENDREMDQARRGAQTTLDQFLAALQNPQPGQDLFAVKAAFRDGEKLEYMWLTDVQADIQKREFDGALNNDPQVVTNVEVGRRYSVSFDEIEDWMFMQGDEMVGGESIKILIQRTQDE